MANIYAGTKTEKNLWEAFAGESQARNKYTYFASVAKKAGYDHPTLYDAYFTKGESKHRFYVEYAKGDQLPREKGFKVGFQEGKHERFPFPYGQTSINPNLRQNPGWN